MTEPLTFVRYELDEQTRDELTPICDSGKVPCFCNACGGMVPPAGRHDCPRPAAWAIRPGCDSGPVVLTCYDCTAGLLRYYADLDCQACGARNCIRAVRL